MSPMSLEDDWEALVVAESLRLNIIKGKLLWRAKTLLPPHQYRAFIRLRRIASLDAIALIKLARAYGEANEQ